MPFDVVRQAAETNEITAEHYLGYSYSWGSRVPRDPAQAIYWYQRAGDAGYLPSFHNLGLLFATGDVVTRDYAKAVAYYRRAADRGFAGSVLELGLLYLQGTGVPRDTQKAIELMRRAADQGESEAMRQLFIVYRWGPGVERDDTEARKWLRLAAEHANATAQCQLGYYSENPFQWDPYTTSYPLSNSMPEAIHWYRLAVAQGHSGAKYYLGLCYLKGKGVEFDEERGLELMRQAADQDNYYALSTLAEVYGRGIGEPRNEKDRPIELLRRSEALSPQNEHGYSTAAAISLRYRIGLGTERDLAKAAAYHWRAVAFENRRQGKPPPEVPANVYTNDPVAVAETLYLRAAMLGDATAFLKIGEMYLNGRDVPRDPEIAWAWLGLANQKDPTAAHARLTAVESQLTPSRVQQLRPRVAELENELKQLAASFQPSARAFDQ